VLEEQAPTFLELGKFCFSEGCCIGYIFGFFRAPNYSVGNSQLLQTHEPGLREGRRRGQERWSGWGGWKEG